MSSFILLLSLTISFTLFPSPTRADHTPAKAGHTPAGADHTPAHETAATQTDLVTQACATAPKKDLCEQTIHADNRTPKNDINDLAFITFEAASTKTVSNIEYITRSTDDIEDGDSAMRQIFLDCEHEYEGAVDDVDNSVNYLASRSKEDDKQIDGLLKDAITAIESCQNIVKGKGAKGDQLTKLNQEVLDLLHNAIAVFHVIK